VFVGSKLLLVEMMKQMDAQEFFENGENLVIYVSNEVFNEKEVPLYLSRKYDGNFVFI